MNAKDCFGNEVKLGDLVVYGSAQSHMKSGFRVGIVTDTEKPTVQPFERYYWGGDKEPEWRVLRPFGFGKVKKGDFAIVNPIEIKDEALNAIIEKIKAGGLRALTHTNCSICGKEMRVEKYGFHDDNGKQVHYRCKYPND